MNIGYSIQQSTAVQPLLFLMCDSADHINGKTGLTPTVTLSKNGGAYAAPTGAVSEIAHGIYQVEPDADDTDTLGPLALHASSTGADPVDIVFPIVAFDPLTIAVGALRPTVAGRTLNVAADGSVDGGTVSTAVVDARIPVGNTVGWPKTLTVGDAYLSTTATAPRLFIKDVDDAILDALGSKNFSDEGFIGTLRLSPLTDDTIELDTPPATIEVTTDDPTPIVYNDSTPGSEYFELQIPNAKTALGNIRTRYSAQFIMNWDEDSTFEFTVHLGDVKFVRKNATPAA